VWAWTRGLVHDYGVRLLYDRVYFFVISVPNQIFHFPDYLFGVVCLR
jgi:hypothetical protein